MKFKNFSCILENVVDWISTGFYILFFIAILLQVFSRYILNSPFIWSEEAARYIDIWFVFLAASIIQKKQSHLKVDLINQYLDRLPKSIQIIYSLLINIIIIIILPILVYGSYILVKNTWSIKLVTMPLPRGLIFLPLTISGCIMLLFSFERIINDIILLIDERKK